MPNTRSLYRISRKTSRISEHSVAVFSFHIGQQLLQRLGEVTLLFLTDSGKRVARVLETGLERGIDLLYAARRQSHQD